MLTPTASVTSLRPGESTTVTITLSGAVAAGPVAYQWDLPDAALTAAPSIAGAAAAGKTISSNGVRTLVVGPTAAQQASIGNGILATIVLTVPLSATPGTVNLVPTAMLGASAGAATIPVPVTAGPMLVLTILPLLGDLNGDGKVDATDYGIANNQALGIAPCGSADINGDGKCDVLDLVLLAKKI